MAQLTKLGTTTAISTALLALSGTSVVHATYFKVTNLVSDGSVPAAHIDPNLINPWGISASPTGPFWLSDNNSGLSTLYDTNGKVIPLVVTVAPAPGSSSGSPTGTVFNGSRTDFQVSSGGKTGASAFLFDSEDGTISGWAPSVNFGKTVTAVDNSNGGAGAVYKGLAIASVAGSQSIYAANFRSGFVEQYDGKFKLVRSFTDPSVAPGYAPFNVQTIGNHLYVTYALQNGAKHDDVGGAGHGYVDEFNLDGSFVKRLVSQGGAVNSPWGLAVAPKSFGSFAGDLLVGNFGDGTIGAFDFTSGAFKGDLLGLDGKPIVLGDLWGLINGNGGAGGHTGDLYFSAGVSGEAHGLFGSIAAPEPGSLAVMALGAAVVGVASRRRGGGRRDAAA